MAVPSVPRAVEGVRRIACSVGYCGRGCRDRYELQRPVYTPVCTFIYNANHIHTPLVLDCPHSQRTLRTPMRKLHILMRKCLLPQHPHNSNLRPASPQPTAPRDPLLITGQPRRRDRRLRRGSNWKNSAVFNFVHLTLKP